MLHGTISICLLVPKSEHLSVLHPSGISEAYIVDTFNFPFFFLFGGTLPKRAHHVLLPPAQMSSHVASQSRQHLALSNFLILANPMGVKFTFTIAFICNSLVFSEQEL